MTKKDQFVIFFKKVFKMKGKRVLKKNDVKNIAELLMRLNETTTTLEVKKELRENDYFATQQDVSNFMMEIQEEEGWYYADNGTFRTYSFDAPDGDDVDDDTDTTDNVSTTNDLKDAYNGFVSNSTMDLTKDDSDDDDSDIDFDTKNYHVMRNGFIVKPLDSSNAPAGSWKVFNPQDSTQVVYLDGSLTREQARYAFYKILDLKKGSYYSAKRI